MLLASSSGLVVVAAASAGWTCTGVALLSETLSALPESLTFYSLCSLCSECGCNGVSLGA